MIGAVGEVDRRDVVGEAGDLLLLLVLVSAGFAAAQVEPRRNFGAKFEVDDRVLHGAGQSEEFALADYAAALAPEQFPTMYVAYVRANSDAARRWRSLGGRSYAEEVARSDHDASIDSIAMALDSLGRDVFVRVGYEANGLWNGYDPASYVPAYRRVVDGMRAVSDRFAFVWCIHPVDGIDRLLEYDPGDEYADWWASDLFQPNVIRNASTQAFLDTALARGKSVMIGEATPSEVGVDGGPNSWRNWYIPFFETIHANPGVKAFCYINRD